MKTYDKDFSCARGAADVLNEHDRNYIDDDNVSQGNATNAD